MSLYSKWAIQSTLGNMRMMEDAIAARNADSVRSDDEEGKKTMKKKHLEEEETEKKDRVRLRFSEFVNIITVLAMMEGAEAQRFIFGMIGSGSGAVTLTQFKVLLEDLHAMDKSVGVGRLERLFKRYYENKYESMDFDTVSG